MKTRSIFILISGLLFTSMIYSQVPKTITHQGFLTKPSGQPYDTTLSMTFKLYLDSTGGVALWTQSLGSIQVSKGVFNAILSPSSLPFDRQYWLEVQAGDQTLSPRRRLTSSPYALRADTANNIGTLSSLRVSGNVGIGTTSPDQLLTINAGAVVNSLISFKQNGTTTSYVGLGTDAKMRVQTLTGTELRFQVDGNTAPMTFYQNGVEAMRIHTSGNVGIGTASPGYQLEVAGTIGGGNTYIATPRIAYGYNANASGGYGAMAVGYNATASGIVAIALGQSVTASGYDATAIGRGTTASGDYSTAMGQNISVSGLNSFGISLSSTASTITAANTMAIMGGNVGIGTTTPSYPLHVYTTGYGGAWFENKSSTGTAVGLWGYANGSGGTSHTGIYGYAYSATSNYGVYGYAGGGTNNYGGYFIGQGYFSGLLTKAGGGFKIDHPLDPENKYLVHSFVESPDMMNVYNGNIITGSNGEAIVNLPSYFQAENIDYKYQLTVIGQFAQAIVIKEIQNNQFVIKTDKPSVKVSWQVTGIRDDEFARQHRIVPEVDKERTDRGKYLNPELFGKSKELMINPPPSDKEQKKSD